MTAGRRLLALAFLFAASLAATAALAADPPAGPPSFQVGSVTFTPGGWIDATLIGRASNTGNGVATGFGAIPYETSAQGHLSEVRFTGQSSRVTLKVTDAIGATSVAAYGEADFAGNSAANLYVSTNSNTLRMRQYWVDVKRGRWEVLAGQAWSLATPNRRGLGSEPGDVFVTRDLDVSLNVGVPYTRAAQARVAYRPDDHFAFAVAAENPQQYLGAGEVILPFAFNPVLSGQFDAGTNTSAPNALPDLLAKAAWDGGNARHPVHVDVAGLSRTFRITYQPLGSLAYEHDRANGLGAGVTAIVGLTPHLRVAGNLFRGDGVGRTFGGLGPDVIVTTNAAADRAELATVHGQSFLFGFEADLPQAFGVSAYYGRVDFGRRTAIDATNPVPNRWLGFGGPLSPNSANRTLHEATIDASKTFWNSPQHGALALMLQYSEVFRQPWYAVGAPNRALVDMAYVNLRYTLP